MASAEDIQELKIEGFIGYSGSIPDGLQYSRCGDYMIYPYGRNIAVRNIRNKTHAILEGHSENISCLALSNDGKRLASGQRNSAGGYKADVLVWDLEGDDTGRGAKSHADRGALACDTLLHRLKQHQEEVQDLAFSCDDEYLCTLGGRDDNTIVIWRIADGTAICGNTAAADSALCLSWCNTRNDRLVTAGRFHLKVWQVDVNTHKLHSVDAKFGKVRRVIQSICIADDDEYAYCGTKTGDLLNFRIDRDDFSGHNDASNKVPTLKVYSRERFGKGIMCCKCLPASMCGNALDSGFLNLILIGGGDGSLTLLGHAASEGRSGQVQEIRVLDNSTKLMGSVTSLTLCPESSDALLAGTEQCNMYRFNVDARQKAITGVDLQASCHKGPIYDVCFPKDCPELIITAGKNDIRIWNVSQLQELLRIQVPNLDCFCLGITNDGTTIVSGWSDGKIRAFLPESGKLKFVIKDAHTEAVTAIAVCNDMQHPWKMVSGGHDGRVRLWNVTSSHQSLVFSVKEHRAPVYAVKISPSNEQCVSASKDGSCIVWDLINGVRQVALLENTVFMSVLFHPDESQLLTCGSNRKITYWSAIDGEKIRELEGSESAMTSLAMNSSGTAFASGAEDRLLKVWHYDDGVSTAIGCGHSGNISRVVFSPDERRVVSIGLEGGIFIWTLPQGYDQC